MPVVGVITCEILELEFAYLLSMDQEIAGVTVVEDSFSLGSSDRWSLSVVWSRAGLLF